MTSHQVRYHSIWWVSLQKEGMLLNPSKLADKPLVSFVISAAEADERLDACLNSILEQTYQDIEIVLVLTNPLDGASGNTALDLEKDKRLTVVDGLENLNAIRAWRAGFEASHGQFIVFFHPHDVVHVTFTERLVGILSESGADIGVPAFHHVAGANDIPGADPRGEFQVYNRDESLRYFLTSPLQWPHSNSTVTNVEAMVLRRDIVAQVDWSFCDYAIGAHDFLALQLFHFSGSMAVTDERLFGSRRIAGGLFTIDGTKHFEYQGRGISAFEMCDDFPRRATELLGAEWENEIKYRTYCLYRHYVLTLIDEGALTIKDVETFDRVFQADEYSKIEGYGVDESFLHVIKESGLMGHVLGRMTQLRDANKSLNAKNKSLQKNHRRMMSIKGSGRRFIGNVLRRVKRELSRPKMAIGLAIENYLNKRPTINKNKVNKALLKQVSHVYDAQTTNIPKIIHYCWVGGNPKPPDIQEYVKSWAKYLPEYEFIEWNESNFDMHYNDYVREAYEHKKWAFVSDVVRLYALYNYGGIYLDIDVEVLKPLDRFLEHHAFSSFESGDPNNPELFIPTGLMGSEKRGKWVHELLEFYRDRHFRNANGELNMIPNPRPITEHTVQKYLLVREDRFQDLGAVTIYPSSYFCPKSWKTREFQVTSDTHAIHHFAGSWVTTSEHEGAI